MTMVPLEFQIKPFILLILIVNLVSLNIIFSKTSENIGNKREVRAFKGMLVSFMVYALVDLRLLVGDAFYTSLPRPLVSLIISIGFGTMSFSCFFWFMHVSAKLRITPVIIGKKAIPLWNILFHIPLFVAILILFTPLHVIIYVLTDTIAEFRPGIMLLLLMDYIYLIAATGISFYNRRRAKTRHEKRKYGSQSIFIIFFTISGILIGFLLNLPAIELCVIPVVLELFVELQDSQIYTDALTRLYNRRRMTDFINGELSGCSAENPLTIMMIDLDFFKNINDILGHDEGDKALVAFSNALKKVLRSSSAVAARWGGDEFVVAGKDIALTDEFRGGLAKAFEDDKELEYVPMFSIGAYSCTSSDITLEQALVNADADLYKEKDEHHKVAGDFIDKLTTLKNTYQYK
ncbi:GGDEF domain-containing protein [Butyrivibrio sp. VCB2006]|uniref:GGDEF domain-containing protein n=1 Tax=Butyrivibrio sp. VCB2006 TaxID=1280679 RepID=UPI00049227C7|nr:GGDEF domain-containing protein [Butyrivibrio sp. VCB2006]